MFTYVHLSPGSNLVESYISTCSSHRYPEILRRAINELALWNSSELLTIDHTGDHGEFFIHI